MFIQGLLLLLRLILNKQIKKKGFNAPGMSEQMCKAILASTGLALPLQVDQHVSANVSIAQICFKAQNVPITFLSGSIA